MKKGQKITEETRLKMQIAAKKRGNSRGSGWKITEEHKRKIGAANSVALKAYFKTHMNPRIGKGKTNDALKIWREGGGQPWNKKDKATSTNLLQRRKFMRSMRFEILKRDNYTCQMCSSKENLQVDHIQSWAEYVELRFSMDNCRTLCMDCHYLITFGKKKPEGVVWGQVIRKELLDE